MKRWEYLRKQWWDIGSDHELDQLGEAGWELVAIDPVPDDTRSFYIFKREVE